LADHPVHPEKSCSSCLSRPNVFWPELVGAAEMMNIKNQKANIKRQKRIALLPFDICLLIF
jgi:hypothetical protein